MPFSPPAVVCDMCILQPFEQLGSPMPIPSRPTVDFHRRLRKDEVFDRLFQAILDGTLQPGERIRDVELQEWLGVSRTPIRLAIDRLVEMNLIESRPNRFTLVSPAAPGRIPELLQVMCAFWELATRLTIETLDETSALECRELLAEAARACREHDGSRAEEAVEHMRRAMFFFSEHSDNELLRVLVVRIGAALRFQMSLQGDSMDKLLLESVFERLDEAVEARDSAAAGEAIRHVQSTGRRLCGVTA